MTNSAMLRTTLDMLYYSGASQAARGLLRGKGAIFMLHHVRPGGGLQKGFAPNSMLEITPEFLDGVIRLVKQHGYELVSMDDVLARLSSDAPSAPFAAFTLDDAYRDNLLHARPVFRRHNCPFTIYASSAIQDGECELWWRGLEAVIAGSTRLRGEIAGERFELETVTDAQKHSAWERLYWPLRNLDQQGQRRWIRQLCAETRVDLAAICRADAMNWEELRLVASDPLCTVGAHTVNHFAISALTEEQARHEMVASADRLELEIGVRPRHFAYPYGDESSAGARDFALAKQAGFASAVTTRKGLVYAAHRDYPMALPRVSLNGKFQRLRYIDVLLSGSAFALWNGFRQLNVA
jgi:peptidoglycan/xylan/chitin deacetylase (PgdA/CDA1 family)